MLVAQFSRNRLLYCLKECFLPNSRAGQQYQYLKHGGDNPVAKKKNDAGAGCHKFHGASCHKLCVCVCVCVCVCACVCYNTIVVYTMHHRKLCTCTYINPLTTKNYNFLTYVQASFSWLKKRNFQTKTMFPYSFGYDFQESVVKIQFGPVGNSIWRQIWWKVLKKREFFFS